jgi:hypothetical protein
LETGILFGINQIKKHPEPRRAMPLMKLRDDTSSGELASATLFVTSLRTCLIRAGGHIRHCENSVAGAANIVLRAYYWIVMRAPRRGERKSRESHKKLKPKPKTESKSWQRRNMARKEKQVVIVGASVLGVATLARSSTSTDRACSGAMQLIVPTMSGALALDDESCPKEWMLP